MAYTERRQKRWVREQERKEKRDRKGEKEKKEDRKRDGGNRERERGAFVSKFIKNNWLFGFSPI